jgi:hypothetical protein
MHFTLLNTETLGKLGYYETLCEFYYETLREFHYETLREFHYDNTVGEFRYAALRATVAFDCRSL